MTDDNEAGMELEAGGSPSGDDLTAPTRIVGGVQQWQLVNGLQLAEETVAYAVNRVAAFNQTNGTGWMLRVFPGGMDPSSVPPGDLIKRNAAGSEVGVWKDWGGTVGVILFGGDPLPT